MVGPICVSEYPYNKDHFTNSWFHLGAGFSWQKLKCDFFFKDDIESKETIKTHMVYSLKWQCVVFGYLKTFLFLAKYLTIEEIAQYYTWPFKIRLSDKGEGVRNCYNHTSLWYIVIIEKLNLSFKLQDINQCLKCKYS